MGVLDAPGLTPSAAGKLYRPRTALSLVQPFGTPIKSSPQNTKAVGFDATDNLVWFVDQNTSYAVTNGGNSFSTGKTVPNPAAVSNPGFQVSRIIRAGSYVFAALFNPSTVTGEIWRAAPAGSDGTAYSWSKVLTMTGGSSVLPQSIASDGTTILVADYADPKTTGTPTAKIWRSTDYGATWAVVYTAPSTVRHFHAVAFDPYLSGRVLATFGDGPNPCLLKSDDSGATWATVAAMTNLHQSVSITFDPTRVYFAPDVQACDLLVMDRATLTNIQVASSSDHRALAVPRPGYYSSGGYAASGGTAFSDFVNAPFSAVDVGRRITMPGVLAQGTTISAFSNANQVTLSTAATGTANATYGSPYTIERPEQINSDCFYGSVDPATGIYYFMANVNSEGTYPGRAVLFYVAPGGRSEILDPNIAGIAGWPFVYGGRLWYSQYSRPLLTLAQALS